MFRVSSAQAPRAAVAVAASAIVLALLPSPGSATFRTSRAVPAAGHVRATLAAHLPAASMRAAVARPLTHRLVNARAYARAKAAANQRAAAKQRATGTRNAPQAAVYGGLDQPGLSHSQNASRNDIVPPDSTGAIGPNHYVEFVNDKIGVYGRGRLALVSSADLDTFDGSTGARVFDPQVLYDPLSQRWFYLNYLTTGGADYLAFGFSKTADPSNLTSGWCTGYVLNTDSANGGGAGSFLADFPKLGHDALHVTFTDNTFTPTQFASAQVWSYPKPAAGAITTCPAPPSFTFFGSSTAPLKTSLGHVANTLVPANTIANVGVDYVLATDAPNHVMTWALGGSGANPTLTLNGEIAVAGYGIPPNAPQPGSPYTLDTYGAWLYQAVAQVDPSAGAAHPEGVWTQHTIAGPGGNGSVVRWYELIPSRCSGGACPASALRQQGNVAIANNFVFNGAISPARDGSDAVVDYNVASTKLLVQIRSQSRNGTDTLGTMSHEVILGASSAAAADFSCFGRGKTCRWGDYAGASPDPTTTNRVWGSNQVDGPFANNGAQWQTMNFALAADEPPGASFTFSPASPVHGSPVSFNAGGSSDPDGSISKFAWTFGDRTSGSGAAPSHTYAAAGHYAVTLTVTDSAGNTSATTRGVTVT